MCNEENSYQEKTALILHVKTYDDNGGHGLPVVPIEVSDGQGLEIRLPETANGYRPDIYIERKKDDSWSINISTDESDISAVITIDVNGNLKIEN